jgi:hypothetical protein
MDKALHSAKNQTLYGIENENFKNMHALAFV